MKSYLSLASCLISAALGAAVIKWQLSEKASWEIVDDVSTVWLLAAMLLAPKRSRAETSAELSLTMGQIYAMAKAGTLPKPAPLQGMTVLGSVALMIAGYWIRFS